MTSIQESSLKWVQLVQGTFEPKLTSLALQIKINFLKLNVKNGKSTAQQSAKDLVDFVKSHEKAFEKDIKLILG